MNVRRHEGKHADFYELLPAIDTFVSEYRLQVDLESFRDCFSFCSIAQIQQTHESFIIAMLAKYLSLIDTSVVAVIPLTSNTRFSCCHDIQYTACHHLPRFNLGFILARIVDDAPARSSEYSSFAGSNASCSPSALVIRTCAGARIMRGLAIIWLIRQFYQCERTSSRDLLCITLLESGRFPRNSACLRLPVRGRTQTGLPVLARQTGASHRQAVAASLSIYRPTRSIYVARCVTPTENRRSALCPCPRGIS